MTCPQSQRKFLAESIIFGVFFFPRFKLTEGSEAESLQYCAGNPIPFLFLVYAFVSSGRVITAM